jgi:uridine kinase
VTHQQVIESLADLICTIQRPHPVRVAIDGVDAAGKTVLVDELALAIKNCGRPVVRASVDGFHHPRMVRHQRGENSSEGYYRDSFDNDAILQELLIPLGPGGNRKYRRAVFDFRADAPTHEPAREAPVDAILLFDGVFLLRPQLRDYWDYSIFLEVDFEISVPRAVKRDVIQSGGKLDWETTLAKYNQRYIPGQKIYLVEAQPQAFADVVMDNNDFLNPRLIVK